MSSDEHRLLKHARTAINHRFVRVWKSSGRKLLGQIKHLEQKVAAAKVGQKTSVTFFSFLQKKIGTGSRGVDFSNGKKNINKKRGWKKNSFFSQTNKNMFFPQQKKHVFFNANPVPG